MVANGDGVADIKIVDSQISLVAGDPLDIKARSMVVHALKDDLGDGGNEESKSTPKHKLLWINHSQENIY